MKPDTGTVYRLAFEGMREMTREPAEESFQMELTRLDEKLAAIYSNAADGDLKVVETVLRIRERRATISSPKSCAQKQGLDVCGVRRLAIRVRQVLISKEIASWRLPPTAAHDAGRLTLEVVVCYPFHPLAGQSVLVVGEKEHAGARHLIVRNPDGTRNLLPEWMTFREAGAIRILSCPRLCVNRLVELRALIDRLMASSPGMHVPRGGHSNETSAAIPTRSVQDAAGVRAAVIAANDSSATCANRCVTSSVRSEVNCPEFLGGWLV